MGIRNNIQKIEYHRKFKTELLMPNNEKGELDSLPKMQDWEVIYPHC